MSENSYSPAESHPLRQEFENILHLFQSSLTSAHLPLRPQQEKTRDKIIYKIISENSSLENRERILSEFSDFGPLGALFNQPDISEIMVNGPENIFYEKQGQILKLKDSFLSTLTFHNIVEKISAKAGLSVNIKKPFAEGKWGPFRLHILRPPVVQGDFHLCFRRPAKHLWTFERLEERNWAPKKAIEIIRQFIRDKLNFLIVGSTSSGKTSVLNACLQETAAHERILSIEDIDEIILPNGASAKLLSQTDPESAKDLIGLERLVRQSLRLRPDRIVIGEVRGGEAKDLLMALATGHRGSISALHGQDHRQALWKLETLAQMGAPQWQSSTIRKLIFSSLNGLLVLDKRDGARILRGIYRITALESSGFLFESLFERNC